MPPDDSNDGVSMSHLVLQLPPLAAGDKHRRLTPSQAYGVGVGVGAGANARMSRELAECHKKKRVAELCEPLALSDEQLHKVMQLFEESVQEGLSVEKHKTAAVKMLPSYVRSVPNGTEQGDYLALDLGGTNFRVLLIRLAPGTKPQMLGKIYRVPNELMLGTGEALFDHIASCLVKFAAEQNAKVNDAPLPLGFTFSFPCQQHGLTSATLVNWTKGFNASGVEGMDVVQLLREAVNRREDARIDVVALLNDTTGTLMSCAAEDNQCAIGMIVGTGTNACYVEKLHRCPKMQSETDPSEGEDLIINTEWGAFGDDGKLDFMRTHFDRKVDDLSLNHGKQIFEKMISGMYLGEIVRTILEELVKKELLFESPESAEVLFKKGAFPTKFVSEVERDLMEPERNFASTMDILEDLGIEGVAPADCANIAYVCSAVSNRAAHLCAATTAALLNRMDRPMSTVAVDGSVYRFHPTFKQLMGEKIEQLKHDHVKFKLMLSEDGSGRGAALVAAVATRLEKDRQSAK